MTHIPPGPLDLVRPAVTADSPSAIFDQIFLVFVVLGSVVGVVVIGYTLWNAYKYRWSTDEEFDVDRPKLGELPHGGTGGRKLLLSFGISAIIVLSLIFWTYGALLDVESGPPSDEDPIEVQVTGIQFAWQFEYENGHRTVNELRVPTDRPVVLNVTSGDTFHNFGIPGMSLKADAIPGQITETWFIAEETGTYEAQCYELCGSGHSNMKADVIVMDQGNFQNWYASTQPEGEPAETTATNETATAS